MIAPGDDPDGTIAAFVRAAGFDPEAIVECVRFANDPAVQTELANLVVTDVKRATTALQRWYEDGAEHLPQAGDLFVVLDGARRPRCVCRTSAVTIAPFSDVDADFAFTEGEADRTLAAWRSIHIRFFEDEARAGGFSFSEASRVVLHRFERVSRDEREA